MNNVTEQPVLKLMDHVNKNVVGQNELTKSMVIALLTGGHVLLEGPPGTAKTRAVKTLASALNLDFNRIQFTPDLLPTDVTGTNLYQKETGQLCFQKGPIFSSMVLADEVNRAPAKVQAALLEAMAEKTVTYSGETYSLPPLFMVLATQNPIEQEGTYPLPEAQMDRFMMKITVDYPNKEAELNIIHLMREEDRNENIQSHHDEFQFDVSIIEEGKEQVKQVYCSDAIDRYIADIVIATRETSQYPNSKLAQWIELGVSPRASIALDKCSRAHAWIDGRDYVTPDDVRSVAISVLGHRIIPTFDAFSLSVSSADIVNELLDVVALS